MPTSLITICLTILFFFGLLIIIISGWYLVWKYSLSHIPIVREVCGLGLNNNNNNKIVKQKINR